MFYISRLTGTRPFCPLYTFDNLVYGHTRCKSGCPVKHAFLQCQVATPPYHPISRNPDIPAKPAGGVHAETVAGYMDLISPTKSGLRTFGYSSGCIDFGSVRVMAGDPLSSRVK